MNPPQIDFDRARELLRGGDATFVDVRDAGSYKAKHIPGAIHLDDSTVGKFVDDTAKDARVVVYCYHGNSSLGATAYLQEQGFTSVASLIGGFTHWEAAGGDCES